MGHGAEGRDYAGGRRRVEVEFDCTCSVCSLSAFCLPENHETLFEIALFFFLHFHAVNSLQLLLTSLSNETAVHIAGCAPILDANFAIFCPANRTHAHVHKQTCYFFSFPS